MSNHTSSSLPSTIDIFQEKHILLSVVGPHAGEGEDAFFPRKQGDIQTLGYTLWRMSSRLATWSHVQTVTEKQGENPSGRLWCCFVDPSRPGGAKDTLHDDPAREISQNRVHWESWPEGLNKVTGKFSNKGTLAFRFDRLLLSERRMRIDLDSYDFFGEDKRVTFIMGASTVCATRKTPADSRAEHSWRMVVALARFDVPWGCWLR